MATFASKAQIVPHVGRELQRTFEGMENELQSEDGEVVCEESDMDIHVATDFLNFALLCRLKSKSNYNNE